MLAINRSLTRSSCPSDSRAFKPIVLCYDNLLRVVGREPQTWMDVGFLGLTDRLACQHEDGNSLFSENLLLINCRCSCFWRRTHYVWVMNIFFRQVPEDFYSACLCLQFPCFKFKFWRKFFLKL